MDQGLAAMNPALVVENEVANSKKSQGVCHESRY